MHTLTTYVHDNKYHVYNNNNIYISQTHTVIFTDHQ